MRKQDTRIVLRFVQAAVALVCALALGSCGFHLRGDPSFPFRTVYINGAAGTQLYADLVRSLRANRSTKLVDKVDQAEAILDISKAPPVDKQILTLSGGGKVREFLLIQTVGFRVHDGKGGEWLPYSEVQVRRDFSFTDSQALAKEAEERLLLVDMQTDTVQQVTRRLQAAHKPASEM
jgi:LPS-assembly lipoprotein